MFFDPCPYTHDDTKLLNMKLSTEEIQRHFPFFENELLLDIINVAEVKSIKKGEHILQQSQYLRSMLLVIEGYVKVIRKNAAGNEFFMHYIQPGQAFALTMIFGNRQEISEVSIVAFEKSTILAIPLSCMDKWMMEYKSWYQFVFDTFRERVRELLKTIDSIVFLNMDERLVFYLKRHEEVMSSKNLPLTKTEIARELNSSREVVTRLLKKLAGKGKLKMHRHSIELVDL
jgi:CRP/FNR family transcriptional regulator